MTVWKQPLQPRPPQSSRFPRRRCVPRFFGLDADGGAIVTDVECLLNELASCNSRSGRFRYRMRSRHQTCADGAHARVDVVVGSLGGRQLHTGANERDRCCDFAEHLSGWSEHLAGFADPRSHLRCDRRQRAASFAELAGLGCDPRDMGFVFQERQCLRIDTNLPQRARRP